MSKKVLPSHTEWLPYTDTLYYEPGHDVSVRGGERVKVLSPLAYEFDFNGNLRVTYQVDNKGFVEIYQDVELTSDLSETTDLGSSNQSDGRRSNHHYPSR